VITKVGDDEITVNVRKKGEKKTTAKTFKVSKDTKVMKRKGKDDTEKSSLSDLKAAVSKAAKGKGKVKGVFAKIEVDDGKATEITYGGGRKGKGKKAKKDE
jgi:hypothetical protein